MVEVRLSDDRPGVGLRLAAEAGAWSAQVEPRGNVALFRRVPPGRHRLTLEISGRTSATRSIALDPGQVLVLRAVLAHSPTGETPSEAGLETVDDLRAP